MATPVVEIEGPERPGRPGGGAQWLGITLPAMAMLVNVGLGYSLATWSCGDKSQWALHATSAVLLLIALAAGLVALREWRRGDDRNGVMPDDRPDAVARTRFLGGMGVASSALFSWIIIAQWLANVFLGPCSHT